MRLSPPAYMAANQVKEQWTRSKMLDEAIPKLRQALAYHANEEETFPLMTPKTHKKVWQTVPIDHARKAAVLVPLVSFEGVPSLLFTMRSSNLPTHASEVSFPGGHFDEGIDASLEETAIRETREELLGDYPWEDIEIIGRASTVPSIKGTPVTPIIGVLPYEISHDSFPGSPDEVDEVFCVALSDLINIETVEPSRRFRSPIPVFPTREGRKIWGLTAVVTRPLLHKLFKPVFLAEKGKEDITYPSSSL
jgi:8-oxo-dGTP pyrophosphatase MutT (NUDIX family)